MNRTLKVVSAVVLLLFFATGCGKSDGPNEPNVPEEPNNGDTISLDYVDLGLPSGTLWAIRNLGADSPEDRGDYYAWGETATKDFYDWKCYKYSTYDKDQYLLNKYCTNSLMGFDGFVDGLSVLEPVDDAARAQWGEEWRMPSREEFEELFQETTWEWTCINGMDGRLLTGPNGNSIFLPSTGFCLDGEVICTGLGIYWSNTLQTECQVAAWSLHFDYENCHVCGTYERSRGQCVRAVRSVK